MRGLDHLIRMLPLEDLVLDGDAFLADLLKPTSQFVDVSLHISILLLVVGLICFHVVAFCWLQSHNSETSSFEYRTIVRDSNELIWRRPNTDV